MSWNLEPLAQDLPLTPYMRQYRLCVEAYRSGCYDEASMLAYRLLDSKPDQPSIWHILAQIQTAKGQFISALGNIRMAFELFESNTNGTAEERTNYYRTMALGLGYALFREGLFREGIQYYEVGRMGISWAPLYQGCEPYEPWRSLNRPVPRNLLIAPEGGYGDTIMCARWLPLLKSQLGIKHVGMAVLPGLEELFPWGELGIDKIYTARKDAIPFSEWSHCTSILSMPAVFQMRSWQDVPPVPQALLAGACLSSPMRIGFCWRAEENTSPVRTRSLPWEVAEEITTALQETSIEVRSLSPHKSDLYNSKPFVTPPSLPVEMECLSTWESTKRYMHTMDLVISVDTACAHLAGTIGVPALVLLPKGSCWRWRLPGEQPVWYGPHVRYYRQPEVLKWDAKDILQCLKHQS
jgi:hypothetical protein